LVAFPNPVQNSFNIQLVSAESSVINVHDVTGRLVWSKESTQDLINIETSNWENGTYIVDVTQGLKRIALKIQVIQ
jgi:hypothetical protein